jgi:hypothetical protein
MSEENKIQTDGSGKLDDLFRKSLENYQVEPSKVLWKNISRKLLRTELAHFNFTNLPKTFWAGVACAVLVGLIFLFNQIPDGSITENDYSPIILKNNPGTISSAVTSRSKITNTGGEMNPGTSNIPVQALPKGSSVNKSGLNSGSPVPSANNSKLIISAKKINSKTTLPAGIRSFTLNNTGQQPGENHLLTSRVSTANSYEQHYLPSLTVTSLYPLTYEDTLRISNLKGILNVPLNTKVVIPQFFTFNLGVAPELSVYRNNGQYSESNFWLNTGMTYHIGKFSVQTGLGLGYIFDQGDYRVNYKSKDSIGYFTSIVSFIVTPGNRIIYTTKDIAVYDSVEHVADNRGISRYTYLQIPLLLGYELFETNRFSIGIKAGPSISFLIASKEASPFIDYPNAQLIRIDNNSLVRVKMNWELEAALDIEYRLTKKFSIYADPTYNHYFKPFENQESAVSKAKDPYSIGIEVGIRINFGQIKNKQ